MDIPTDAIDKYVGKHDIARFTAQTKERLFVELEQLAAQGQVVHVHKWLFMPQYEVADFCRISAPKFTPRGIALQSEDLGNGIPGLEEWQYDHQQHYAILKDSNESVGIWSGWYDGEVWDNYFEHPTHTEDLYLQMAFCRRMFPEIYSIAEQRFEIPPIGLEKPIELLRTGQSELLAATPRALVFNGILSQLAAMLKKLKRARDG